MSRYFAFLRAINVGGHTVKMDHLRELFAGLGLAQVETYIASGNVVFAAPDVDTRALEKQIEASLLAGLGYEVATFLRTEDELAALAEYQPFPPAQLAQAATLNVAFLAEPLEGDAEAKLMALRTDIDDFQVHGREIFWLCRKKQSESTFSNAVLEKALRRQATLRGINTVRKLADKYTAYSL
jgi:uncharacterized protein (DUF1697 family)